ncbi:EthD domain-containing protein [Nocardioides zeae]|uniref:EthD domain-containing protein n=1 Tax=Nocardioides zeae TaxID=1457234 RepID=UPI0019D576B8
MPYFVVAVLTFADREAALAALASPEGQAGSADMGNFAVAGVEVTMWEAQD